MAKILTQYSSGKSQTYGVLVELSNDARPMLIVDGLKIVLTLQDCKDLQQWLRYVRKDIADYRQLSKE